MKTWQLQDAKAKFSEVVKTALVQGPQEITLRGEPVVIVISKTDFENLAKKNQLSFVEFIQQSPLKEIDLKIKRDKSSTRNLDI